MKDVKGSCEAVSKLLLTRQYAFVPQLRSSAVQAHACMYTQPFALHHTPALPPHLAISCMLTLSFSPSSAFITFCASEVEWGATLVKPTSQRSDRSLQSSEIFDRVSSFQLYSVNVPPVVLPLHTALGYLQQRLGTETLHWVVGFSRPVR